MVNYSNIKNYSPIIVGIGISILAIIWIVKNFNLSDVFASFLSADYRWLIPVILLILASYALRAIRWGLLFSGPKKPTNISIYTSLMIGYLANNILPARMGEFVRVYVLKTREGISKSSSLATIIVERTSDLMVALLLLSLVLLVYPFPQWLQTAGILVSLITIMALVFILTLNYFGNRIISLLTTKLVFLPKRWIDFLNHIGNEFIAGLSGLKNSHRLAYFIIFTVIIWTIELCYMLCMAWAFYLPVTVTGILFVMIITGLSTIIPSSPGYFGTYEFFTLAALALIGITGDAALSYTIATHALTFIFSSVIGAICIVYTGVKITSLSKAGE